MSFAMPALVAPIWGRILESWIMDNMLLVAPLEEFMVSFVVLCTLVKCQITSQSSVAIISLLQT